MATCFYCGKRERVGPGEAEACIPCERFMDSGIILISYDEDKTEDMRSPYRTGGWVVVTEERVKQFLYGQYLIDVIHMRCAFIDHASWIRLGLPWGEGN